MFTFRCMWIRFSLIMTISLFVIVTKASAGYSEIEVRETAGIARDRWPVLASVPVTEDLSVDSLNLVRVDGAESLRNVAFQILDVVEPVYAGDRRPTREQNLVKTVEIAFFTDIPAGGKLDFRLYGNEMPENTAPADAADKLTRLDVVKGERLGRTIDTGAARFEFDPGSGQMINYQLAGSGFVSELVPGGRVRPVHGSADVWSPPNRWGNVRNWNYDPDDPDADKIVYDEISGPFVWRSVRSGRMPLSNEIEVSVSYAAFDGMPFLIASSWIRFSHDTAVNAVRNNQLVFRRGDHTHGLYMRHDGELVAVRGHDPDNPDKHFQKLGVEPLPPDTPFVGLFHENRGHGIGMVALDRANNVPGRIASPPDAGAHYYFNDAVIHRDMARNFMYFIRAEVYQSVYEGSTHRHYTTVVPAGATFASRSVILVFNVGENDVGQDRFKELERWTKLLRFPLCVTARKK